MIVRVAGAAPIRGRQPLYFLDDVFLARAKVPAPEKSDRFGFGMEGKVDVKVAEMEEEEKEVEIGEGVGVTGKDDPKPQEQPESVQNAAAWDSAKPVRQRDHERGESMDRVEGGVEQQPQEQPSEHVQGVTMERVEGEEKQRDRHEPERDEETVDSVKPEQRDQPELERGSAKVEGGHEIAR